MGNGASKSLFHFFRHSPLIVIVIEVRFVFSLLRLIRSFVLILFQVCKFFVQNNYQGAVSMDRRSAFIAVRRDNSQMPEEGSEYECEISYPPPQPLTHPTLSSLQPHPEDPQFHNHHQQQPRHIHPSYWYWFNAYSHLLEQQAVTE